MSSRHDSGSDEMEATEGDFLPLNHPPGGLNRAASLGRPPAAPVQDRPPFATGKGRMEDDVETVLDCTHWNEEALQSRRGRGYKLRADRAETDTIHTK